MQNKPHTHGHGAHAHIHGHGSLAEKADDHGHTHEGSADDHNHVHDGHADGCGARAPGHAKNGKTGNVFWGLFILMVLCPCQPLIPILMYPASTYNMFALVAVTLSFAVCTIATMLTVTYLGLKGVRFIKLDRLERYSHVIAGAAILLCGVAVRMLPS